MNQQEVDIRNKRAQFEYFLLDRFEAGLVLTGTEIKSIRDGKASIKDAYCLFIKDELWVKNMHITEYSHGTVYNHEPTRIRKLLLTKREIKKLRAKVKERGQTIVPTRLFTNERGFAKLEIALAKGKKSFDKRNSIKEKDMKRDLDRNAQY